MYSKGTIIISGRGGVGERQYVSLATIPKPLSSKYSFELVKINQI